MIFILMYRAFATATTAAVAAAAAATTENLGRPVRLLFRY